MFSLMDRIIDCLAEFKWLRSARVASKVTAANQSAENGHMLIDGNDIALFKIAFVPLIVKMKDD